MTWEEAKLTLQLEAERQFGFAIRRTAELARGYEDQAAANVRNAVRGPR